MNILEINDIEFSYGKNSNKIFDKFNLVLNKNEILAILGPSGCGKSTLLRLISGLENSNSGTIKILDNIVDGKGKFIEPEMRNVGMVFQDYALFPHMTVYQNVYYGAHRKPRKERKKAVLDLLEKVELSDKHDFYPHELSGGQRQRVALARTIASEPKLLLLDEPFSNLDEMLKSQIRADLKKILDNFGISTILVTHDKNDADFLADRELVLD